MLKKFCLMLLVAMLCSGAAFAKKAPKAAKAAPAPVEDEFDESGFVGADSEESAPAVAASDADAEDFEEAEDAGMSRAQKEDLAARKKFEEEQRQDEYANSERRRDWLKDRLMLEVGLGSRMPFMGETGMGMGFGAGVEYITRWHVGLFGSFGFLPKGTDNDFDYWDLEGGTGYKVGLNYYLFPKNPMHLGISASYGTVYFDHDINPDKDGLRKIIIAKGFQFDLLIAYMTNEWYYLQFSVGMYYSPELGKSKESNPSFTESEDSRTEQQKSYVSRVENKDGMSKTGIVFGVTIGYAFPEFFPDDTEKRRREREKARKREGR